jgi:hypothetical protein
MIFNYKNFNNNFQIVKILKYTYFLASIRLLFGVLHDKTCVKLAQPHN